MGRAFLASSALLACLVCFAAAQGSDPASVAQRKLDSIRLGTAKRGSAIVFSPGEANAWARAQLPKTIPKGVRNLYLDFGHDVVTGTALVDFLKVRDSQGLESNWAMRKLLEGERPVKAIARVVSKNGDATVYLTRLEVAQVKLSGGVLDFMIDNFVRHFYPNVKIGEPIELEDGIDHLEVRSTGVSVIMSR